MATAAAGACAAAVTAGAARQGAATVNFVRGVVCILWGAFNTVLTLRVLRLLEKQERRRNLGRYL